MARDSRWEVEDGGVLIRYDPASDTYHCAFGPSAQQLQVHDPEREVIVRVDVHTRQVVGFSIPGFRAWHARHADAGGDFEVRLPPTWTGPSGG